MVRVMGAGLQNARLAARATQQKAPRERGVIATDTEALALFNGRKTQWRFPVDPQPERDPNSPYNTSHHGRVEESAVSWIWRSKFLDAGYCHTGMEAMLRLMAGACPLGRVGDLLWVKEAFGVITGNGVRIVYRADDPKRMLLDEHRKPYAPVPWHHASRMHRGGESMPRLPRTMLEIVEVRAHRLHGIGDEDVAAEGTPGMICGRYQCSRCNGGGRNITWPKGCPHCAGTGDNATAYYRVFWDARHGKRFPYDSNPFVFALTVRRIP
jgi:hypothetical protein